MNLYQQNAQLLYKQKVVNENEIFEFDGKPEEEEFQEIFEFYQANLEHFKKYGCNPSYFIIRDEDKINACARLRHGTFLIGINHRVLHTLFSKYKTYFNVVDVSGLEDYR